MTAVCEIMCRSCSRTHFRSLSERTRQQRLGGVPSCGAASLQLAWPDSDRAGQTTRDEGRTKGGPRRSSISCVHQKPWPAQYFANSWKRRSYPVPSGPCLEWVRDLRVEVGGDGLVRLSLSYRLLLESSDSCVQRKPVFGIECTTCRANIHVNMTGVQFRST